MRTGSALFIVLAGALIRAPRLSHGSDLGVRRFGVRGGISMNPDQFYGGLFLDAGRLFSDVRLQPSFEFGIGNGMRLAAGNLDALYPFGGSRWRPYAGGGLGVNYVDVTDGVGEGRGADIETVLNIVGGVEWGGGTRGSGAPYRYVVEGRLGFGSTPDFKLAFGLAF